MSLMIRSGPTESIFSKGEQTVSLSYKLFLSFSKLVFQAGLKIISGKVTSDSSAGFLGVWFKSDGIHVRAEV